MSGCDVCIRGLLEEHPIKSSAPCRIDSGGTWDIKALAFPLESIRPVTVNLAINLRTYVTLAPFTPGWVRVSSEKFSFHEEYPFDKAPFNSRFGLFFAIASFFNFHGLEIRIRSTSPVEAGLGGSSTASVAALKAFSVARTLLGGKKMKKEELLHVAFHLEDAINGGCGMQDHGAAVFGGVNKWTWSYSGAKKPFERESLFDKKDRKEVSKNIIVAYSGTKHSSARINRLWVEQFLKGETRSGWIEANEIVNRFALHLKEKKWKEAAQDLCDEITVRRKITPEAFIPVIDSLIGESEKTGCGARFAGAGGGGTVWALGEPDRIDKLRIKWADILKATKQGRVLECTVDPVGAK
jgi:D-glycero-alpha-D-manno-heptose-7-phosphate kinase